MIFSSLLIKIDQNGNDELRKFDRSLDKFIRYKPSYSRDYTVYLGDTLLNSPKVIEDE